MHACQKKPVQKLALLVKNVSIESMLRAWLASRVHVSSSGHQVESGAAESQPAAVPAFGGTPSWAASGTNHIADLHTAAQGAVQQRRGSRRATTATTVGRWQPYAAVASSLRSADRLVRWN